MVRIRFGEARELKPEGAVARRLHEDVSACRRRDRGRHERSVGHCEGRVRDRSSAGDHAAENRRARLERCLASARRRRVASWNRRMAHSGNRVARVRRADPAVVDDRLEAGQAHAGARALLDAVAHVMVGAREIARRARHVSASCHEVAPVDHARVVRAAVERRARGARACLARCSDRARVKRTRGAVVDDLVNHTDEGVAVIDGARIRVVDRNTRARHARANPVATVTDAARTRGAGRSRGRRRDRASRRRALRHQAGRRGDAGRRRALRGGVSGSVDGGVRRRRIRQARVHTSIHAGTCAVLAQRDAGRLARARGELEPNLLRNHGLSGADSRCARLEHGIALGWRLRPARWARQRRTYIPAHDLASVATASSTLAAPRPSQFESVTVRGTAKENGGDSARPSPSWPSPPWSSPRSTPRLISRHVPPSPPSAPRRRDSRRSSSSLVSLASRELHAPAERASTTPLSDSVPTRAFRLRIARVPPIASPPWRDVVRLISRATSQRESLLTLAAVAARATRASGRDSARRAPPRRVTCIIHPSGMHETATICEINPRRWRKPVHV